MQTLESTSSALSARWLLSLTHHSSQIRFSCNNPPLFKIHSLNVLPKKKPTFKHWRMVVRQDILSRPGRVQRALLKAKIPPADSGSGASVRGDLQSATVNGSHERRQSKKAKQEEWSGGRNERGLNQCYPLQLSAKKDRCSLCLFVWVRGCMPAQTRINQELFIFKSISALTNLIPDQCKTEWNTYWAKF